MIQPIPITPVHVAVLLAAADGLLTVGDGERAYPPANPILAALLDAEPPLVELEVSRSPLLLDQWRPTPAGELVAALATWRASFRGQPVRPADRALAELVDRLWPDARCDAPALASRGCYCAAPGCWSNPCKSLPASESQASEPAPEDLRWHVGRHWMGNEIEKTCPCPKEPCGLVDPTRAVPECEHHPVTRGKSIRQSHRAHQCHAAEPAAPLRAQGGRLHRRTRLPMVDGGAS